MEQADIKAKDLFAAHKHREEEREKQIAAEKDAKQREKDLVQLAKLKKAYE